jgi:uncharacterized protein YggE
VVQVIHLFLLSLAAQRTAAAQTVPDTAEIRTAGTARQSVPADLATITLKFTAQDSTQSRAESRLALRADSMRRALASLGIPRDSMLTGSRWYWWNGRMEVQPRSQCVPAVDPRRPCAWVYDTIYRANEIIDVHIRDLTKVGAVIDAALAPNVTDITNPQFSATDIRPAVTVVVTVYGRWQLLDH